MERVYFDNSATTKLDKQVLNEMLPYLEEEFGNPSSKYSLGREAKKAIEEAREKIAKVLNADSTEIYFTAGGSESDNMAIKGVAYANRRKGNHIITSKIEHPAVLETCKALEKEDFEITYINVDENGILDLEELKNAITSKTILITIMYANNEIGTIQPISEIAKIAKDNNILFHTDSVQAISNIKIDVEKEQIDLLSLSGHKFYGPKGVGAIYIRKGTKIDSFINGGNQERNKRAGTENVAGIVGLGKAIELAYEDIEENNKHIKKLRDYYVREVQKRISDIKINGDLERKLPGNSSISFRYIEGEGIMLGLDSKGICVSTGSACSSASIDPSHVLLAIGLEHELALGSIRVSIGKHNTIEEVNYLLDSLEEVVKKLREMSIFYQEIKNN